VSATVPKTQSARVYQELRKAILDGELAPGERLRLVELAARYSVSQSVVREALTRLSEQGLAVSLPQQGFRVITLSETDLEDLTNTRVAIEGLVLGRAVLEGDVEWESTAVAAHHRLVRAQSADDGPEGRERWVQAHREFHRALLAGCASPRLKEIALGLRDAAELYRRWSPSSAASLQRIAAEHQTLVEAAVARDGQQAVQVLSEHLHHTREALLLHSTDS
jgi:DNA-binding GntR family transcriptional regulator